MEHILLKNFVEHVIQIIQPFNKIEVVEWALKPVSQDYLRTQINNAESKGKESVLAEASEKINQAEADLKLVRETLSEKINHEIDLLVQVMDQKIPDLILEIVKVIWGDIHLDKKQILEIIKNLVGDYTLPGEALTIELSSNDYQLVVSENNNFLEKAIALVWKEDTGLSSGECKIHSRFGTIDASFQTRLQKLGAQLKL